MASSLPGSNQPTDQAPASIPFPILQLARRRAGLECGQFQICNDLVTNIMRAGGKAAAPGNGVMMDAVYGVMAWVSPAFCNAPGNDCKETLVANRVGPPLGAKLPAGTRGLCDPFAQSLVPCELGGDAWP